MVRVYNKTRKKKKKSIILIYSYLLLYLLVFFFNIYILGDQQVWRHQPLKMGCTCVILLIFHIRSYIYI